jgi:hypothetical protein
VDILFWTACPCFTDLWSCVLSFRVQLNIKIHCLSALHSLWLPMSDLFIHKHNFPRPVLSTWRLPSVLQLSQLPKQVRIRSDIVLLFRIGNDLSAKIVYIIVHHSIGSVTCQCPAQRCVCLRSIKIILDPTQSFSTTILPTVFRSRMSVRGR